MKECKYEENFVLELSDLNNGIYILGIQTKNGVENFKVLLYNVLE
jgi:hypothetical protein